MTDTDAIFNTPGGIGPLNPRKVGEPSHLDSPLAAILARLEVK